ncbi:hypothetical protein ACVH9Z_03800 [Rhodococcus opacus]|uniref:hypothetical protein n=1 Tax=Rhodococcus opacus TaxID=37919 RepID=UPI000EAA21C1|nr:hypothetical protein [Rhodococcus opacus]QZS54652.1 hypothetical protein FXW36_31450 [Rhodococcus opacus]RKM72274.1 hypothetical protein COO55_09535 [Rhodococcus opacus]UNN03447.1 hypothetical protein MOO23_13930 [Rhodococcus opacus]UZG57391.1 hypothetical protein ONE62_08875 [Rhodococcus opacus]
MALPFYPLVFMNLLFAATTLCLARPSRLSAAATVAAAVLWIFGNGPLEGDVLWALNSSHGLTVSDLLSAVALGIAIWGFHQTGSWNPLPKRPRRLLHKRF